MSSLIERMRLDTEEKRLLWLAPEELVEAQLRKALTMLLVILAEYKTAGWKSWWSPLEIKNNIFGELEPWPTSPGDGSEDP